MLKRRAMDYGILDNWIKDRSATRPGCNERRFGAKKCFSLIQVESNAKRFFAQKKLRSLQPGRVALQSLLARLLFCYI